MSKQLSAELEIQIANETKLAPKERIYSYRLGWADGYEIAGTKYGIELESAQERIKHLEDWLREISINCPGDARVMANEALTPNNQNKEDEQ